MSSKRTYIPINSINDIDLSKINIGNINNRYIDMHGNRYATRFNIRTKRVQIVRIALGEDEAREFKGVVVSELSQMNRRNKTSNESVETDSPEKKPSIGNENISPSLPSLISLNDIETEPTTNSKKSKIKPLPSWIQRYNIAINYDVNVSDFIKNMPQRIPAQSERLFGIISNIKNGGLLNRTATTGSHDPYLELTLYFDENISKLAEKINKLNEELSRFPKDPEHYAVFMEKSYRKYMEKLPAEQKINFIKAFILGKDYLNYLEHGFLLLEKCSRHLENVNDSNLSATQRQSISDAANSIEFVKETLSLESGMNAGWLIKEQIYHN